MKPKLLTLILFVFSIIIHGQITKYEAFILGTKLSFYPNECGNTIPEAIGKLTFCDSKGNLGIVEESYGLNGRKILQMLDNRANDDEVFITTEGLSIKKRDGAYENVPNIAIPDFNTIGNWQNDNIFRGGLVMPNNNVIFSSNDYFLYIYNRTDKTISILEVPNFRTPRAMAYDDDLDVAWIIAREGSTQLHLYNYSETNGLQYSAQISSIINASQLASGGFNSPTLTYKDNHLYVGIQSGLFKIDLNTFNTTSYNTTSTPSLPYDNVSDLKFDANGALWLATNNNGEGAILKFNVVDETYEQFQLPRIDNPSFNYRFYNLAINSNDVIWASAINYTGLIRLEFNQNTPQWEQFSLTDLQQFDINLLYTPDNIFYSNDTFYFTALSSSSAGNFNADQIAINNNGNWSSITDNDLGNTSFLVNKRYNLNIPDDEGGMWWFNGSDNLILHRKANDEQFLLSEGLNNLLYTNVVIDVDGNPIVGLNTLGIYKVDLPVIYPLINDLGIANSRLVRNKDQVFWNNNSDLTLNIIKYNQIHATFNLDDTYQGFLEFNLDTDDNVWFAKETPSGIEIKKYETFTQTTIDYLVPQITNRIIKVVPSINGAMWFVTQVGLIFYDGENFITYLNSDYPELYNTESLIVDTNGVAHVLQNDLAAITRIENAGTANVSFSIDYLEGINAILPALDHYRPNDLSLDNAGNMWTHASNNTFKVTDTDTAKEFNIEGETYNVSGLVYNDLNENDSFDIGEEYAGQLVALKLNGEIYNTFTNGKGIYEFYIYEENAEYEITLPTIGQFISAPNRQLLVNVGGNDQNYEDNDFKLKPKYINSLYVKSSSKTGVWGFVRDNFKNTFVTAIGNISNSKTYNNLDVTYTFVNEDENSTNVLPSIDDVKVYELDPTGSRQLINFVTIDQRNNEWRVNLESNTYTKTQLTITPQFVETNSKTDIKITIPTISPLNTYIIEIDTGIFDATQTGSVINHGISELASDDFVDNNNNQIIDPIILFPKEDRNDFSGFPIEFDESPYIDPRNVYDNNSQPMFKQVYSPAFFSTIIFSSYDPNDKLVDEGVPDIINDRSINRKWLTYTIRFENTGNFSAKDIVITDLLDDNLDPNSVKVIEASHDYTIDIIQNVENESTLKFSFNDIFLPFDDANNDGYIKFMIKANEAIAENTIVNNTANIYFDQNPAIITNTIQNRFLTIASLGVDDFNLDAYFQLYPNPTNDVVTVKSKLQIIKIELFSMLGRKVLETNKNMINVSTLDQGSYIIKITSDSKTLTKKLIIK